MQLYARDISAQDPSILFQTFTLTNKVYSRPVSPRRDLLHAGCHDRYSQVLFGEDAGAVSRYYSIARNYVLTLLTYPLYLYLGTLATHLHSSLDCEFCHGTLHS
ncbi:hypothetical protein J6590_067925 [Homalodisca vitripennis]|nr:hypothetical protein J6590_067925 [Homalodisca vitripennis]